MRKTMILFSAMLVGLASAQESVKKLLANLNKYQPVFTEYKRSNLPLLIGNVEMGGLASPMGNGFYETWLNDNWVDSAKRVSLPGLEFKSFKFAGLAPTKYYQSLDMTNGVITTDVAFETGSYTTEMFYSFANQHVFVMKVINNGKTDFYSHVTLPYQNFKVKKISSTRFQGTMQDYYPSLTRVVWSLNTSNTAGLTHYNEVAFSINPGDSIVFVYSLTTNQDGADYQKQCFEDNIAVTDYNTLKKANNEKWMSTWSRMGFVIPPAGKYAETYFRGLFWILCSSGSKHYFPAEIPFADISHKLAIHYNYYPEGMYVDVGNWDMHGFTYGAAGQSLLALQFHGMSDLASNMLGYFYKPEILKKNVGLIYPVGKKYWDFREESCDFINKPGEYKYLDHLNADMMIFAHQIGFTGENLIPYAGADFYSHMWQANLNAFAVSLFHFQQQFFPDDKFMKDTLYPVMKGTAEFWSSLYHFDNMLGGYMLPPLNSLSEDLNEIQLIDIVLGSKWSLMMSARYANQMGIDKDLAKKWQEISDKIYIPQDDKFYLEYLGSPETREGGGYMGIRGYVYTGFPSIELKDKLNAKKIANTLDRTWERNFKGGPSKIKSSGKHSGMIAFVAGWFALADIYNGRSNQALEKLNYCVNFTDPSGTAMYESSNTRPYYIDGYDMFVTATVAMVLQSYNNEMKFFPAIPSEWKDVEFYNLPAQGGHRVSGKMQDGKTTWIRIEKNGTEIAKTVDKTYRIVP